MKRRSSSYIISFSLCQQHCGLSPPVYAFRRYHMVDTERIDFQAVKIDSGIVRGSTTGQENKILVFKGIP